MAIPKNILDLIKLAKDQELAENSLESLVNKKAEYLSLISSIDQQISTQQASVIASRILLRNAASGI